MLKTSYSIDPEKRDVPVRQMGGLLAVAVAVHFIVLFVVMPSLNNLFRWIVPSRASNSIDTLLTPTAFTQLSFGFIGAMIVLLGLAALFVRFKKDALAFLATLFFFGASLIYFMLVFGNIANNFWNIGSVVLAVVAAVALVVVFELPVLRAFKDSQAK